MLICYCREVSRDALVAAFQAGCRSVEDFQEATDACTGCRSCRPDLEALLQELTTSELNTQALAPPDSHPDHLPNLGGDVR